MIVFYILGPTIEAGQILMAIFSAGLVAVTFWLGLRFFEDYRVALYASIFILLNPVVVYHSSATDSTVPMALMVNLSLIALSYTKRGSFKAYVWAMVAATLCPYLRVDGFIVPLVVLGHYLCSTAKKSEKLDRDRCSRSHLDCPASTLGHSKLLGLWHFLASDPPDFGPHPLTR